MRDEACCRPDARGLTGRGPSAPLRGWEARPGAVWRAGSLELLTPLGVGGQGLVLLARPWTEDSARRWRSGLLLRGLLRAGLVTQSLACRLGLAAVKLAHPEMGDSLHDEHGCLGAPGAVHPHMSRLYHSRFPAAAGPDLGLLPPELGSRLFLALAYEAGAPLGGLWASGARPALSWTITVAMQLTQALAHLHGRGLVHHDVQPGNVLVRRGPHAVLIDLGAAKQVGVVGRGAVYGAAGWLAPERLGPEPAPPTPLVDLYGVGMLLRYLTAGTAPPPLARLIVDATAPDPARRAAAIPSAAALLERLAGIRA